MPPEPFHLAGSALRALAASAGRPVPPSPEAFRTPGAAATEPEARDLEARDLKETDKAARDRIWELAENLHCSIVGTCLTTADARALLAKIGRPDARTITEHRLHGEIVQIAGRRDGGARLLQKTLDRRHEREIARFGEARTADAVRALWRAALERGDIPGAYWAAITHPATDWPLVQDIFGEVHMLSHLVGRSNRADIRRLRQLETDLAERDAIIAHHERRIAAVMEQRDALGEQARAVAVVPPPPTPGPDVEAERHAARHREDRLARERAHAAALEERVAVLMRASARLSRELEGQAGRCRALEAEVASLEAALSDAPNDEGADDAPADLAGRTVLYVGGRPRQVATLRRFTAARGGCLLSHDGGIDDNVGLLPGLVRRSEVVLLPVTCVSHEAATLVKRFCGEDGVPFHPVRSASLASFVHALMPARRDGPAHTAA